VRRTIEVGAIAANIEDGTRVSSKPLFEMSLAVERIEAAREAADAAGIPLVINARTDGFIVKGPVIPNAFEEVVRRVNAYRRAGDATCLRARVSGCCAG
jgi:2-methylisocitrate lyase-like PEP mutase family enzyme